MLRSYTIPVHVECEACFGPVIEAILRSGVVIKNKDTDIQIDDPILTSSPNVTVKVALQSDSEEAIQEGEKRLRQELADIGLLREENEQQRTELKLAPSTPPFYRRKLPLWLRLLLGSLSILAGIAIMAFMISGIGIPFAVMAGIGIFSVTSSLLLGAQTIFRALNNLRYLRTNMDTLLALSGLAAIGVSIAHLFIPGLPMLFDAPLFIFGFQYLGDAAKEKFRTTLSKNMSFKSRLKPTIKVEDIPRHVELEKIKTGSIICVPRNVVIPIDGIILDDEAMVYETIINGNTMPHFRQKNSKVPSGMRIAGNNLKSFVRIQTTADYENSYLTRLENELSLAKSVTVPVIDWSQKILRVFVPIILIIAVALFIASFFAPPLLLAAIMTLACACPCSIGLIVPAVTKAAMTKAEKQAILFKDEHVIQAAANIDTVLFDLNGTLTMGEPAVKQFVGKYDADLFAYIAALQEHSDHAFARAIRVYVTEKIPAQQLTVTDIQRFNSGIRATIDGKRIVIGNEKMIAEHIAGWTPPSTRKATSVGTAYVAIDGKVSGYFILEDPLREGALTTIQALKKMGMKVGLISGASETVVNSNKELLDADFAYANCTNKSNIIEQLKNEGRQVAMFGDGGNDVLAMLHSSLGVAIKSSSSDELTINFAGATIDSSSLLPVVALFETAKQAAANIQQNIIISLAVNSLAVGTAIGVGIAIASGALLALSFVLNPAFGAAAMFLLFGVIAVNVMRFRGQELAQYQNTKIMTQSQEDNLQRFSPRDIAEGLALSDEPSPDETPSISSKLPSDSSKVSVARMKKRLSHLESESGQTSEFLDNDTDPANLLVSMQFQ